MKQGCLRLILVSMLLAYGTASAGVMVSGSIQVLYESVADLQTLDIQLRGDGLSVNLGPIGPYVNYPTIQTYNPGPNPNTFNFSQFFVEHDYSGSVTVDGQTWQLGPSAQLLAVIQVSGPVVTTTQTCGPGQQSVYVCNANWPETPFTMTGSIFVEDPSGDTLAAAGLTGSGLADAFVITGYNTLSSVDYVFAPEPASWALLAAGLLVVAVRPDILTLWRV